MFALIRGVSNQVVAVGAREAVEAERLSPDDQVWPLVDNGIPDGHVAEAGAAPEFIVEKGRVERKTPSRALRADEVRERTREARSAAYPAIGDQFDAIMKGFAALADAGIELPAETQAWIDACKAVKIFKT